jgi:hypothetical protein
VRGRTPIPSRPIRLAVFAAFAALVFLVFLVFADVVLGLFSVPAAAAEHLLVQAVLWPFVLIDRMTRLLPHKPGAVLLRGVGLGVIALSLAHWADARRRGARFALEALIGAPSLLVILAFIGAGMGLAPPIVIVCLAAVGFGTMAALPGPKAGQPTPTGLPRRLPVRALLLIGAGLALANAATVFASGPGDSQVPFEIIAGIEGLLPAWLLPGGRGGHRGGVLRHADRGLVSPAGRSGSAGLRGSSPRGGLRDGRSGHRQGGWSSARGPAPPARPAAAAARSGGGDGVGARRRDRVPGV